MLKKLFLMILNFFVIVAVAQEVSRPKRKARGDTTRLQSGCVKEKKYQDRGRKRERPQWDERSAKRTKPYRQHGYGVSSGDTRFIHDAYTSRRGIPEMLKIFCKRCNAELMSYQKDGPGRLLRCYLDRIHSPQGLKERQHQRFSTRSSACLSCDSCQRLIGMPMIYRLENRPAYRMISGVFYFKKDEK